MGVAGDPSDLTDVAPLREVPRVPEHCDRQMRKMQNPAVATGKMITVWVCPSCGAQLRETAV